MKCPSLPGHFEKEHPNEERTCVICKQMKNCLKAKLYESDVCIKCNKKEECPRCKKHYNKSYIKKHKEICDGQDNLQRTCKICGFTKNRELFYPTKYTCIECLSITETCNVCQKEILCRNMNRHKLTHTEPKSDKPSKTDRLCNRCHERKVLDKFSLGKYTCKDCLKQKIQCSLCPKIFSFRYEKEHNSRFHASS